MIFSDKKLTAYNCLTSKISIIIKPLIKMNLSNWSSNKNLKTHQRIKKLFKPTKTTYIIQLKSEKYLLELSSSDIQNASNFASDNTFFK